MKTFILFYVLRQIEDEFVLCAICLLHPESIPASEQKSNFALFVPEQIFNGQCLVLGCYGPTKSHFLQDPRGVSFQNTAYFTVTDI
jgi:hypothetical protein